MAAYNADIPSVNVSSINFAPLNNSKTDFTLNITLTATDGTSTTINLKIDAGSSTADIVKAVMDSIPSSAPYNVNGGTIKPVGWDVAVNSNGTTISIYSARPVKNGGNVQISNVKVTATGTSAKPTVIQTNTSPTSIPVSESVTFGANSDDGTSTVQTATTFDLDIDGVDVVVTEAAGTTYEQVEADLYNQAIAMGLTGISQLGNTLVITTDFSGDGVDSVSVNAATVDGSAESFIDTTVTGLAVAVVQAPPPPIQL